jgi:hypothetical protein
MQPIKDLECLDGLIAKIGSPDDGFHSAGPYGLLLEHLQAARHELLGSMRAEYGLSLRQAAESVDCIQNDDLRDEVERSLRGLMDSTAPGKRA